MFCCGHVASRWFCPCPLCMGSYNRLEGLHPAEGPQLVRRACVHGGMRDNKYLKSWRYSQGMSGCMSKWWDGSVSVFDPKDHGALGYCAFRDCKDHGSSGCCASRGGPPQSQRTGKASLPVPIPSATMNISGAFDLSLSLEGTASISGSACSPPRCGAQLCHNFCDSFSAREIAITPWSTHSYL
jgi:hypothetical protein